MVPATLLAALAQPASLDGLPVCGMCSISGWFDMSCRASTCVSALLVSVPLPPRVGAPPHVRRTPAVLPDAYARTLVHIYITHVRRTP